MQENITVTLERVFYVPYIAFKKILLEYQIKPDQI